MKIRLFSIVVVFLLSGTLSAQTKKIAFESHGGNPANFQLFSGDFYYEGDESDFGLPVPAKDVKTYRLDSVIYVSDSVSVIIQSEYSRPLDEPKAKPTFTRQMKDTVSNSLFSQRHSLDSIRAVLKKEGYYINANTINKAVFIGYDNKKPTWKKEYLAPLLAPPDDPPGPGPFGPAFVWMVGAVLLLSLAGGWFTWKYFQPRLQQG